MKNTIKYNNQKDLSGIIGYIPGIIVLLSLSLNCLSQKANMGNAGEDVILKTATGDIYGTLLVPGSKNPVPVVLIISGSGPTDRNGNNPMMTNNSLKMTAEALFDAGVASLRYDKRGIAKSEKAGSDESELRFENYIDDAAGWIEMLKRDERFNKVIVLGHSEGSLIGMIAARETGADAFISVAGAGKPADEILKEQLKTQPSYVKDLAFPIIDKLKKGDTVADINPLLNSLFRPSVQPYLISWFKYNPAREIKKLKIPVLIIQGTTDLQVKVKDAEALKKADKKAELVIVEGMNHILKEAGNDKEKNMETYDNPDMPLHPEYVKAITSFLNSL
jgi:pimeloyl-ACP methyl ester carboxylesterase